MKRLEKGVVYCGTCEKPLAADWVACPYCGKSKRGQSPARKAVSSVSHDRFTCPGCGRHSTAEGWNRFCPECKAFVHFECMVLHMFTPHACPVCGTRIGDE